MNLNDYVRKVIIGWHCLDPDYLGYTTNISVVYPQYIKSNNDIMEKIPIDEYAARN